MESSIKYNTFIGFLRNTILIIFVFAFFPQFISCSEDEDFFVEYEETGINNKVQFTCRRIGEGVIDNENPKFGNVMSGAQGGQGVAIYKNYMFRLHKTGICCIYDLSDINNVRYINSYKLGSYGKDNHANCAQFSNEICPETGFPYLYLAPCHSPYPCAVEKVTLDSSSVAQEISIQKDGKDLIRDWIIGDDGYLWGIGSEGVAGTESYHLSYYKFKTPDLSERTVTLNPEYAEDYFEDNDSWENIPKTYQGAMVHKGKLYHLFGTTRVKREIRVYDTKTHQRVAIINLNKVTFEEPEDIAIWLDNKIIITLYGVNYALLLEFENNNMFP